MNVYLEEKAIEAIIRYTAIWYKREAMGYLHGTREEDRVIIEDASDMSRVSQRTTKGVNTIEKEKETCRRLENIVGPIIGDFHSHTQSNGAMPLTNYSCDGKIRDLEDMLNHPYNVYIVVAIRDKKRSQCWTSNKSGELYGTAGDFHFTVAAYLLDESMYKTVKERAGRVSMKTLTTRERRRLFKRVPVVCPSVKMRKFTHF